MNLNYIKRLVCGIVSPSIIEYAKAGGTPTCKLTPREKKMIREIEEARK
jgi:hypothetical protein